MTSRKTFEVFLYKNKLNQKSLIDISGKLSNTTIENLMKDLMKDLGNPITKETVYVFSDGNCRNNGRKNAKAGYSIYFSDDRYAQFNKTRLVTTEPTNNKAELSGIKAIFKTIDTNKELFQDKQVVICTDSQYSINCIVKWSSNWIKNNWLNSKKEPVKNKELIQSILELQKNINVDVSFKHVFSHIQEPQDKTSLDWFYWQGNNKVDTNINKLFGLVD
jgi:ribonuclease HI